MTIRRINLTLPAILLAGVLLSTYSSAWASSSVCVSGGTGMGGTGMVANGTGMGGTGIQPENSASTTQLAGRVMFSTGRIEARNGGSARLLSKGDAVCVGDTILSAKAASAQLKMIDNELIAVRPGTRIRIDHYAFHKKRTDNIMLSLFEGACRIVSGEIGKEVPQNDIVKTRIAIIGIRGTDHELVVIPADRSSGYTAGVYDKVNRGITYIKTETGTVDIHANEVGFAASQKMFPRLLQSIPAFYSNLFTSLPAKGGKSSGDKADWKESEMLGGTGKLLDRSGSNENFEFGNQFESDTTTSKSIETSSPESQNTTVQQPLPTSSFPSSGGETGSWTSPEQTTTSSTEDR